LQCVAVCYSVWQCVAVCCSVLQCVAVCGITMQCRKPQTSPTIGHSDANHVEIEEFLCYSVLQCVA